MPWDGSQNCRSSIDWPLFMSPFIVGDDDNDYHGQGGYQAIKMLLHDELPRKELVYLYEYHNPC